MNRIGNACITAVFTGISLLYSVPAIAGQEEPENTIEYWQEYYDQESDPLAHNCISNTDLSFSGDSSAQISAIIEQGQGFFGSYACDLDQDNIPEMIAVGSWYQGSGNEYVNVEVWIYDYEDNKVSATLAYKKPYAELSETISCSNWELSVDVHEYEEKTYIIVYESGTILQKDDCFAVTGLRYEGPDKISIVLERDTLNSNENTEAYMQQSEEYLKELGLDSMKDQVSQDLSIASLKVERQYEGSALTGGSIRYQENCSVIPLTAEEIRQTLADMGYSSVMVCPYEDKYYVITYENTYLSYTMTVDPVSGIAEVGFQGSDDGCMGSLNLRSRSVLSGNPLPAVPTSKEAVFTEALARAYVESRLEELELSNYIYASEDETLYRYYDFNTMWYLIIYKYSGQIVEHNYRGVIINEYDLTQ